MNFAMEAVSTLIQEKFRQCLSERARDDELRWSNTGSDGTQPPFLWFATVVAGFAVRTEHLGVTSIVRALQLRPKCYDALLDNVHSSAVRLDELSALWTRAVLRLFPNPLRVNGRRVLVG